MPLSAIQRGRNPGYARLPGSGTDGSQTLFFGERGSEEFEGYGLFDLSVTYQIPVWRTVRPWVKVEVLNVAEQRHADWLGHDGHGEIPTARSMPTGCRPAMCRARASAKARRRVTTRGRGPD